MDDFAETGEQVACAVCGMSCVWFEGVGSLGDGEMGELYECLGCGARWIERPVWIDDTGTVWTDEALYEQYGVFLDGPGPNVLERLAAWVQNTWWRLRRTLGVPVDDIPF